MNETYMELAPFLVSKNPRMDYGTVVAPDWMSEQTAAGIWRWVGAREEFDETKVFRQDVLGTPNGDLTFFFRISDSGRKDNVGRDVQRADGVCCTRAVAERIHIGH